MAPFSMKCTSCGEYIYKGRKFNARKETTEDKYLGQIAIYRFYIRCTRCSAEIVFKTDPKNMDYAVERGARRNFEAWRPVGPEESDEAILDRMEEEQAAMRGDEEFLKMRKEGQGVDKMEELEKKQDFAKREMEVADAIDALQDRNARIEARRKGGGEMVGPSLLEVQRAREDAEDAEAARKAFQRRVEEMEEVAEEEPVNGEASSSLPETTNGATEGVSNGIAGTNGTHGEIEKSAVDLPPPTFKRTAKKKSDFGAKLGIKKKPALV